MLDFIGSNNFLDNELPLVKIALLSGENYFRNSFLIANYKSIVSYYIKAFLDKGRFRQMSVPQHKNCDEKRIYILSEQSSSVIQEILNIF